MDDLTQYGQGEPDDSHDAATFNVGTVMTSQGNFDTSIGTDVRSDGEEENTPESTETLPPTTRVHVGGTPPESGRPADVNAEAANATQASGDLDVTAGSQPSVTAVVTPVAGGGEGAALRGSQPNASAVRAKATGRPKGARRASPSARATFASPDGPALSRDPMRVVDDAQEMQRHSKISTASNRLGGSDLRVLRDNMSEMNSRVSNSGNKRDSIESSTSGATYASNKRTRARKRIEQLQKEMDEVEARQSSAGGDMMQVLVFMREEADRRAETEDRRRREDREARLAAERQERDERESIRRDDAAAAAAIRLQEMELNRSFREEQNKKEAVVAAENRLRYEERLERSRAEARERHEQLMLLISALQRGSQPQQ
ncbi:hypothetical protein PR002_g16211 [Phytophthora rubi]|uniref:Uncharacterized protein n=1 Tax=Phytophthora rubi TaxID=129364 RepID=A0A6A3KNX6_9STRA|nr:hypothetical protein PR002_g16211 [Phytophthora rubi]